MKWIKFTIAMKLWIWKNWTFRKYNYSNRDDRWQVIEEFYWWLNYETQTNKITVPKWFISNFGTVPWILWLFINKYKISFLLHDFLYTKKYNLFERKECDIILLEALAVEWVGIFERTIIYLWVRLFGFNYYYKD